VIRTPVIVSYTIKPYSTASGVTRRLLGLQLKL